jgi:hypothetical protein
MWLRCMAAVGLSAAGAVGFSGVLAAEPMPHKEIVELPPLPLTPGPEATGFRTLAQLLGRSQRVSSVLKTKLMLSSVKLFRAARHSTELASPWCDANVVNFRGEILFTSAAHCFDMGWLLQQQLMGSRGEYAAIDIASRLPFRYEIRRHEDSADAPPLAVVDGIAESVGAVPNELVLLRPTEVTNALRRLALPARFGLPVAGQEIYFVGAPAATDFHVGDASLTYIGESQQYDHLDRLSNAVLAHGASDAVAPGASGAAGISPDGLLLLPLRGALVTGEQGQTPEDEAMWHRTVSEQTQIDFGDDDVVQFGQVDSEVVAVELRTLLGQVFRVGRALRPS